MVQQSLFLGTTDNDDTGDSPKPAGAKINANFAELYSAVVRATAAEIRSGADRLLSASGLVAAAVPQPLIDAATIAVDWTAGENFTVTLGGNRTLGLPSNGQPGTWRRIQVSQDSAGNRTLAFATGYLAPGGLVTLSLSPGPSAVDVMSIYCRTTSLFEIYLQKAIGA